MTALLQRLQFPDTLLKQAGEIWFEHSDESLFFIAVEPDRFVIELLNPAHERSTGLRTADVSGRTPHECLPPAVADAVTEHYRQCVEAGEATRYEESLDLPGGVRHWQLHDSTTQHLAVAGLALSQVQLLAPDDPALAAAVERGMASLTEAQREIRAFSYLLFPPSLDRDGLASTLRHFVQGLALRTGLKPACKIDDAADGAALPVQRAVLRGVQAALTNFHRHAQATRVSVTIQVDGPSLKLRIADNGVGLPVTKDSDIPELGVGVPGMRSRVRQFGGDLSLTSG